MHDAHSDRVMAIGRFCHNFPGKDSVGKFTPRHACHQKETLVTRNTLPAGTTRVTSFEGCLFGLGFGTNLLSVKKLSAKVKKTAVLFRARAQFLDAKNNLMGYFPEPIRV